MMFLFGFVGSLWVKIFVIDNLNLFVLLIIILLFNRFLFRGCKVVFNMLNLRLILFMDVGVYVLVVFMFVVFKID